MKTEIQKYITGIVNSLMEMTTEERYEYFDDALDVTWGISAKPESAGELRFVEILITAGGPHVTLCSDGIIEGCWGNDYYRTYVDGNTASDLWEWGSMNW